MKSLTSQYPLYSAKDGNMKQHMLTHKIRDVPPHLFEKTSPSSVSGGATSGCSLIDETSNTSNDSRDLPATSSQQLSLRCVSIESLTSQKNNNMASFVAATANIATTSSTTGRASGSPVTPPTTGGTNAVSIAATTAPLSLPLALIPEAPMIPSNAVVTAAQKRSPDVESVLPVPKRQSSAPKHLCHVCNKNFSSSSALQIHMRTHTGDKPFRCTVCLKAFTTKGNLKVHMGTHMWTNGASRRGRRMSLELPPLPIAGKETQSDLFHRRPDLFYPYLPTPFLNGVHQKLNEISSLQTATGTMTNGFFPFGGYGNLPLELKRSSSPISEKFMTAPLPSLRHMAALEVDGNHPVLPPWDLHFERKSVDDHQDRCTPSPPRQSTQRGEGLAA